MNLGQYTDALALLADESRMRLCALLREKELCVTDLVKVRAQLLDARLGSDGLVGDGRGLASRLVVLDPLTDEGVKDGRPGARDAPGRAGGRLHLGCAVLRAATAAGAGHDGGDR